MVRGGRDRQARTQTRAQQRLLAGAEICGKGGGGEWLALHRTQKSVSPAAARPIEGAGKFYHYDDLLARSSSQCKSHTASTTRKRREKRTAEKKKKNCGEDNLNAGLLEIGPPLSGACFLGGQKSAPKRRLDHIYCFLREKWGQAGYTCRRPRPTCSARRL